MSAGPITVSVHSVRPVIAHARVIGLDVERLLAEAGIELDTLADGDARVSHPSAVALWKHAVLASNDEAFGLHAAETSAPPAFDVLGYAMLSSATLGDAWARLCRYHRLLHDAAMVQLSTADPLAQRSHTLPAAVPPLPRAIADLISARWVTLARPMTGLDFAVHGAGLRHREPADVAEYARVFRAPVSFEQPITSVTLAREPLATPLVKADPGLCAVLDRHAQEVLDRLPRGTSFGARVQELIAAELHGRTPSVEDIAGARSPCPKVAFLLGFSEASAFHRAFKRWTGTTPAEYRRSVAVA